MNPARTVRVGSRSSPLALAQTEEIVSLLRARFADVRFDVVRLSTSGDRNATAVLTSLGRGAFVKDIERAVLDGDIDFAVHSAKDVGPDIPDGLRILPVGERTGRAGRVGLEVGAAAHGPARGDSPRYRESAAKGADQGVAA